MGGKFRPYVFAAILILGLPLHSVCGQLLEVRGKTMGTTYLVKLALGPNEATNSGVEIAAVQEKIKAEVDQRLAEINQSMSTYIADSEISKFNSTTSTEPFKVSSDFLTVAAKAKELHDSYGGRFDATVGPLVRFWGFGGGETPKKIPAREAVEKILKQVGTKHFLIQPDSIQKRISTLELDFSAIAKGYGVDEVCEIIEKHSENFMVEIGGEVRARGTNPDSGQAWAIGVELPNRDLLAGNRDLAARIELKNQALATSGDYRNFVVIEGKEFQHTIDPTTGYPVDGGVLSVSVVAPDCMSADGIATALMALPFESIKDECDKSQLGVFVMVRNDQGKVDWWKSEHFPGEVLMTDEQSVGSSGSQNGRAKNTTNPIYLVLGTVLVFGLAISGMAIGVIMGNRQLKGSCGGLSAMNENGDADASPCSLCTKPATECSKRSGQESSEMEATASE